MPKLFDSPPNIIMIITDQLRNYQHWPSDYWQNFGSTEWFAKNNSIRFDNAIIAASMCSPSRGTFWTSSYQKQSGVYDTSTQKLNENFPSLLHYMKSKGYDVEYRGKWYLLGTDEGEATSTSLNLSGAHNWDPPDGGLGGVSTMGGGDANFDERYLSGQDGILDFLKDREKNADTPFLLVASFVNPHDIMEFDAVIGTGDAPENAFGYTYANQGITSPPSNQEPDSTLPYKPRGQQEMLKMSPPADKPTEHYVNFYAQLATLVDSELTQVLNYVSDTKSLENTLIIRFADHGEQALSHWMVEKAENCYEETINVPLYFSHPKLTPVTNPLPQVVSLLDFVPTIADIVFGEEVTDKTLSFDAKTSFYPLQGQSTPQVMTWTKDNYPLQGKSIGSLLANPDPTTAPVHPEGVVFCYDDEWGNYTVRCLRTESWTYAIYSKKSDNSNPKSVAIAEGPPIVQGMIGRGNFDYELYYLVDDASLPAFPKGMPEYMQALLVPTKGTDQQQLINLANPDFGAGNNPTVEDINEYWNPYVQPIWTELHNQLLNQMLDVNALPLGAEGYLDNSGWETTTNGDKTVYASTTGWPYRVTPTWMQGQLTPQKFKQTTT